MPGSSSLADGRHRLHVHERVALLGGRDATAWRRPSRTCRARRGDRRWPAPAASCGRRADPVRPGLVPAWCDRRAGRQPAAALAAAVHRAHVVPHPAVAHVGHRQHGPRIELGHRRRQPGAGGQRAGGVAGAIHRLREDRERLLAGRLDDDVEGLGDGDAELVDRHRLHRAGRRRRRPSSSGPGMRTSKYVIAEPLMKRSRTFSPGGTGPVQLPAGAWPFIR